MVLSANTKNCLFGREQHCKNRETFLKHNVVFQWNHFSSSEYHLLHKYLATKVTTRNNLFLLLFFFNPYIPKGKIVLWCEDTTLTWHSAISSAGENCLWANIKLWWIRLCFFPHRCLWVTFRKSWEMKNQGITSSCCVIKKIYWVAPSELIGWSLKSLNFGGLLWM